MLNECERTIRGMDTTTGTVASGGEDHPYVSCIRVNGAPILPPLLNEGQRNEMRYYRQLAIEKEEFLRTRRMMTTLIIVPSQEDRESSRPTTAVSTSSASEFSPKMHLTSTPRPRVPLSLIPINHETEEEEDDDEVPVSLPLSTSTSSSSLPKDVDVEVIADIEDFEEGEEGSESDGGGAFASAGSSIASTGTFIIKSAPQLGDENDENDGLSEGEVEELEDEASEEPQTVIRRPYIANNANDLVYKRKRPKSYFQTNDDTDEEETVNSSPLSLDPTILADTSNLRNYYLPNKTPTKDDRSQLMPLGAMKKGEVLKPIPSSPSGSTQERIVMGGGLSKFQNKIQKINPSLLKHQVDIRSPLLKGLVFPDPLERSTIVTKPYFQINDDADEEEKGNSSPLSRDSTILADTYSSPNKTPTKDDRSQLMPLETGSMKKGEVVKPIPPSPSGSTQERIIMAGGLSKFQNKIQKINPSLLKHPVDIRSPLLKGLVFPDPLERSTIVRKIPSQVYDSSMKMKFAKMTAAVKGYLTRRLLNTEKVQIIIQTIRDTVELLLNLYEENPPNIEGTIDIKEEDQYLHHRLVQQLTGACHSFHDLFFKISIKERMAIIANDREKIKAKALKNVLNRHMPLSPSKRSISSATLRSMERRQTQSRSPTKKDNQIKVQKSTLKTISDVPHPGSQTVKPKGVKSYNVSPKRRRLSMWTGGGGGAGPEKQFKTKSNRVVSSALSGNGSNANANIYKKRPSTALPSRSVPVHPMFTSSQSARVGAWGSETFSVPADAWTGHPNHRESRMSIISKPTGNNGSRPPRPSISRASIGGVSSRTNTFTTTRVPWKK